MSAPMWFVVNGDKRALQDRSRDTLNSVGLNGLFDDCGGQYSASEIRSNGPGGSSGVIVCGWNGEPPVRMGYYPNHQKWVAVNGDQSLWVGVDKQQPVTPDDLRRPRQLSGHRVELGDGNRWLIPVLRHADGTCGVPYDIFHDTSGQVVQEVAEEYQGLWLRSGEMWDALLNQESMGFDFVLSYFIDTLSLNYRVNAAVNQVLRLLNSANWNECIGATLDLPKWREMVDDQKKTQDIATMS